MVGQQKEYQVGWDAQSGCVGGKVLWSRHRNAFGTSKSKGKRRRKRNSKSKSMIKGIDDIERQQLN